LNKDHSQHEEDVSEGLEGGRVESRRGRGRRVDSRRGCGHRVESKRGVAAIAWNLEGEPAAGQQPREQRGRNEAVMGHTDRRRHGILIHLRLREPLCLGPPVLEPDLDLRLRQLQLIRKLCPLCDGQVGLLPVFPLESRQLGLGERRSLLAVSFMLAEGAAQRRQVARHQGDDGVSVAATAGTELLYQLVLKKGSHERSAAGDGTGSGGWRRHGGAAPIGRRRHTAGAEAIVAGGRGRYAETGSDVVTVIRGAVVVVNYKVVFLFRLLLALCGNKTLRAAL
jgi:hypothetical protein